jgi:transposase-like protein
MRGNQAPLADTLTTRQHRAIIALLQNITVAAAAHESGVAESTLYRWLRESLFRSEFRKQRRVFFERTIGLAQRASTSAIAEVIAIMQHSESDFTRLAAAKVVLDLARETDIEQRLEALEDVYEKEEAAKAALHAPSLRQVS